MFVEDLNRFVVETGDFEILIGKNVNDIVLKEVIRFESSDQIKKPLTLKHPLMMWLKTSPEKEVVNNFLGDKRKVGWWGHEDPLMKILTKMLKDEGNDETKIQEIITQYFGDYLTK
jgi:hypothetical protein